MTVLVVSWYDKALKRRRGVALFGGSELKSTPITRRSFMASVASVAIVATLPGCSPGPRRDDVERRALLRMARLLYPHDGLDDGIYRDVLQPLFVRADGDGALAADLRAGIEMLDREAGGSWRTASPDRQLEALDNIQESAFFETMRDVVQQALYEHPTVWELIGYEGPSVQYGGYLHRGFDDIDWLPVE